MRTHANGLLGLALVALAAVSLAAQPAAPANSALRIGFLSRELGNSNRTDVTAAMKVWMLTVAKEQNVAVEPQPQVFDSVDDMLAELRLDRLDVFSASMEEFLGIEKSISCKGIFASIIHGKVTEQYVLLVRKERTFNGLPDLRGESIVVLDHPRTSLAPLWLDSELLRDKLPVSTKFFGKLTYVKKANLAILPVFFKQAAAALVTRNNFETAAELNPQLSRQIKVVRTSPELIPGVGAYRKSSTSAAVELYRTQALRLGATPAGRLILNLFQTDGIVEIQESELFPTRAFLADHARLKAEAERKGAGP